MKNQALVIEQQNRGKIGGQNKRTLQSQAVLIDLDTYGYDAAPLHGYKCTYRERDSERWSDALEHFSQRSLLSIPQELV